LAKAAWTPGRKQKEMDVKHWCLALGLALLLVLSAGRAMAYEALFLMGDPSDNVTTLEVVVGRVVPPAYKMAMKEYNPGVGTSYELSLVKMSPDDPCRYSQAASRPQGNGKLIYMPGDNDLSKLFVEMSDTNHFNQKHRLSFVWVDQCHFIALITAEAK
jgi:hypothetical protein